jgi:protein-tyrosine phosphatase
MTTTYFICYGNICRSPFAEHYARARASSLGTKQLAFGSGGIGAVAGMSSTKPAQTAALELGVDLSKHQARPLDALPLEPGDLLIAMDRHVFGVLATSLTSPLKDVKGPKGTSLLLMMQPLLRAGAPPELGLDIPDPMGEGVGSYRKVYRLLIEAVDALLASLRSGVPQ